MKKLFKTNDIRYNSLQGKTVAVRTIEKTESKSFWDTIDFERRWNLVYIEEIGYSTFVDNENNEHNFADIIKVF